MAKGGSNADADKRRTELDGFHDESIFGKAFSNWKVVTYQLHSHNWPSDRLASRLELSGR